MQSLFETMILNFIRLVAVLENYSTRCNDLNIYPMALEIYSRLAKMI